MADSFLVLTSLNISSRKISETNHLEHSFSPLSGLLVHVRISLFAFLIVFNMSNYLCNSINCYSENRSMIIKSSQRSCCFSLFPGSPVLTSGTVCSAISRTCGECKHQFLFQTLPGCVWGIITGDASSLHHSSSMP